MAGAGSGPRSYSCSWDLGFGLHLERSHIPGRGWGRCFGTPLGAVRAVVCATHSPGCDRLNGGSRYCLEICTDGSNSSCGPWQEGLYPWSAVPYQVPMALHKTPVLRFSVIIGLPETRESFACVCTQDPHPALCPVTQQKNSLYLPPSSKIVKSALPWLGVVVSKALRVYVCTEFCSSLWH